MGDPAVNWFRTHFTQILFLLAALVIIVALVACGDDDATIPTHADGPQVEAEDLQAIYTQFNGISYMCLYVYAEGYKAGGPAMWCERTSG